MHAALERLGDDWTVVDDGLSRNGSYLNGDRVTSRRRLRDGDVLTVGGVAIAFRAPGGESVSRPTVTALGPHVGESLTPAQRRALIALCRPFKDSTYATPATNQQIADELVVSVDAVKSTLRGAVRAVRRRCAAAESEARDAGAAGDAHRRDHPSRPVTSARARLFGGLVTHTVAAAGGDRERVDRQADRVAAHLRGLGVDLVEVARVVVGDVDAVVGRPRAGAGSGRRRSRSPRRWR